MVLRIALCLLLCLVGGGLALVLLSTHYGVPLLGEATLAVCGAGGGCDVVSQSEYSAVFGLPLAAWGLFFYGSLLALLAPTLFSRTEEGTDPGPAFAFLLVALALAIDVVLLGLQVAVIKAFCRFCLATYVVNLGLLAGLWPYRRFGVALNFLFTRQSRRALAAWVVGSLAVGAAAAAGNAALTDRKALASSSILGIPTLIQAPAPPAEKGSVEERLAQAQAEARMWKDTLDDERRREEYLEKKARDQFNGAEVVSLDVSRSVALGAKDAPIAVVSFSDFMCPFCRDLALGLKNYLPNSGERVRVHYKHFPLDTACNSLVGRTVHQGACELARGGICAEESGRFWDYHDRVFAQPWTQPATRQDVLRLGGESGLDSARFGSCLDSAATRGRLTREIEEGGRVGVGSTPTIFMNGRKLKSANVFFLALEEERKRLNLPPLRPPAP